MSMTTRLFAIAAVYALCSTPVRADIHYYTEGHGDIGLGDEDSLNMHLHLHEGATLDGDLLPAPGEELSPTEAVIVVPESTFLYAQSNGGANDDIADHLGILEGDGYWFLPEHRIDALHSPFLGVGAEEVDAGVFVDDVLTLTLCSCDGPGYFGMADSDNGWLMSTFVNGIDATDKIEGIGAGSHGHFAFYFSEPGTYQVKFEASGTRTSDGLLETSIGTYTFQVVPEPSVMILVGSAMVVVAGLYIRRKTA